jgi:hypothetical protein
MFAAGCGTSGPVLSVKPAQSNQSYLARFTQAYVMRNAAGDYEVVLVDDPIDRAEVGDAGQPLNPQNVPPLRQVLHIRLLWKPLPGARPDSPAATNASLHWYVLGGATAQGTSLIRYAGTAFVGIVENGHGADVTIRNGMLNVAERRGELVDPLKSFSIDGKVDAEQNDARLEEVMDDVKAALVEAKGTGARSQ